MTRLAALLLVGLGCLATYEIVAAITGRWLTISELTWRLLATYPRVAFLFGLGTGLLLNHLFLRGAR